MLPFFRGRRASQASAAADPAGAEGYRANAAAYAARLATLDAWVSGAMELLAEDPGWKAAYDAAGPIDFAFVGARSGVSVVGHLRPSADAAGGRLDDLGPHDRVAVAGQRLDDPLPPAEPFVAQPRPFRRQPR